MPKVLLYYAHPGHRFSQVNRAMWDAAQGLDGITRVDLYAEYPRFNINVAREQTRLTEHDIIVFQYPVFWYATPSLLKEWMDLVLEHGFAYGSQGTALTGKTMQLCLSTAGPEDAYAPQGYQHYPLRTFLTPMEQSARLCGMRFLPPYVLYGALSATDTDTDADHLSKHVAGYATLLAGLRDGRIDQDAAIAHETLGPDTLPLMPES